MLDSLVDFITGGPVAYLVILGLVAGDAVVPIFPSETALITGGLLAQREELALLLVILSGGAGGITGHTILYVAGTRAEGPLKRRLFGHERARRRLDWMLEHLEDRPWLLMVADFIPGARTAAMFAAGTSQLGWARFYAFALPGALLWAGFHALLGYLGGTLFKTAFLPALLAGLAVAGVIALVAELVHRRVS